MGNRYEEWHTKLGEPLYLCVVVQLSDAATTKVILCNTFFGERSTDFLHVAASSRGVDAHDDLTVGDRYRNRHWLLLDGKMRFFHRATHVASGSCPRVRFLHAMFLDSVPISTPA